MKWARAFLLTLIFTTNGFIACAQSLQTLVSFNGTNGEDANALTLGRDGNFYGTTVGGGSSGLGTTFQITTNGTLTTIFSFDYDDITGAYPDGASPNALTLGSDGNLYGTTSTGGGGGNGYGDVGTIFRGTGVSTLYSFDGAQNYYNAAANPNAMTLGSDGNLYGTTQGGGLGTMFRLSLPSGQLTSVGSFGGTNGAYPNALTLGNDGNLYGTTQGGGSNNEGTVFQVTTNGTLTTLANFNGGDGAGPQAALTLGRDGNFYGTTEIGGSSGHGAIFQVTTNGALTTLVSFVLTNGVNPMAGLTLGSDGSFYGTTSFGGSGGYGTVFKVTTNGTLTTLYSFTNGSDGGRPQAAITLGRDGNFYGTTGTGGSEGYGTVFRLIIAPQLECALSTTGSPQITLTGLAGQNCQIQVSADLATWITLTNLVVATNGLAQFTDTTDTNLPQCFYRAATP